MSLENLPSAIFSPAKMAFIAYAVLVYADKLKTSGLEFGFVAILFFVSQVYHDDYLRIRLNESAGQQKADLKVAAGVVLLLLTLIGGLLWYHVPASPAASWNPQAIRADFQSFTPLEGGNGGPIFTYLLRNTTDSDYDLKDETDTQILFRNGDSFRQWSSLVILDLPIFIPAGKAVSTNVRFKLDDNDNPKVAEFLRARDDGFVLFDRTHRYEIGFPKRPQ